MRAVVQRVSRAKVTVNEWIAGEIGMGLLVLLGVGQADTEVDVSYLAEKIAGLRIFEDDDGKMNRSVREVGGSVLAVSNGLAAATALVERTAASAVPSQNLICIGKVPPGEKSSPPRCADRHDVASSFPNRGFRAPERCARRQHAVGNPM